MILSARPDRDTNAAPPRQPLRVLIVDDNRDAVLSLMMLLRSDGHDTKACYSGAEVLRCVSDYDPDVLLLDIGLPDESGWDVARKIRATQKHGDKRPLLIGITGQYTKGADRILAEMSGFDYYLVKPADPKVLTALMENAARGPAAA